MAIFRLCRMPVRYRIGPSLQLVREYPFPVPLGRTGIPSGEVVITWDPDVEFRFYYREDADSFSLDITAGAQRAYRMADVLSLHPDAATEYTMLTLTGEPEKTSKLSMSGLLGKTWLDAAKNGESMSSPALKMLKEKTSPLIFDAEVLPKWLVSENGTKKSIFPDHFFDIESNMVKHGPHPSLEVTLPAGVDLEPGDKISLSMGKTMPAFLGIAGVNGKSSYALSMLKQHMEKQNSEKAIVIDSLAGVDYSGAELKVLASLEHLMDPQLVKQLKHLYLYGTSSMSPEEIKGILGQTPNKSISAHYPPEPPKSAGVTVGKNLPANLHSLNHGHFKTDKKAKKKYSYKQSPPLNIHTSLDGYLTDLVPASKKAEASAEAFKSKVEEAKTAMITLHQDLKPGLMLGVDLAKPTKGFADSLTAVGLKIGKAMSIPSEFFKED